ncbi:hypothetical protein [Rubrivirga marina]|uniref:hypothetical protein n=1 Tax=Rubrivirga marina TaxID=1196024 RepID=UPI001179BA45|nr:hypothetical protein [Rubrivirga marina]
MLDPGASVGRIVRPSWQTTALADFTPLNNIMFKSDKFIYIQMQKTGCTHIAKLLSELFDGEQLGKHNAATPDQIQSDRHFISSIRNPWDWYISLWTFGVQGNGGLFQRLTTKNLLPHVKASISNPRRNYPGLVNELSRDASLWTRLYDDSDNVESFRTWLRSIHDPSNSLSIGEGYGNTKISSFCGFMTYRYLYLCCANSDLLAKSVANKSDLKDYEKDNCYIDSFIRQESLECDLCLAIENVRSISQEEREFIYKAKKTNTSKRSLSASDYYDEGSIELVRSRDRLLIDKFDYSPPNE